MNDSLKTRLEAIDTDCESVAQAELDTLYESAGHDGAKFRVPSPQAAEAIWLRLIARKEHEFIQEMIQISKPKPADQSATPVPVSEGERESIEDILNAAFAEERYLDRMQEFFQEVARRAVQHEPSFDMDAKRLDLIDVTYRAGVRDALRRARRNVLDEFKLKQQNTGADVGFLSQWRQYSTLSPWRSIGTIVLLMLTSYLIAFIIRSDAFRGLLERAGWPSGAGL